MSTAPNLLAKLLLRLLGASVGHIPWLAPPVDTHLGLTLLNTCTALTPVPNIDLPALCSPKFKPGPPADEAQTMSNWLNDLIVS